MRSVPGAAMRRKAPGPTVVRCECGGQLMTLATGLRVVRRGGEVSVETCAQCSKVTKIRTVSDA